jgi:hypothetical protein
MIDVKSRKCIYADCTKQPKFNISGEKKWILQNLHAYKFI